MFALTVQQPWASALVRKEDPKTIENRVWATRHRDRLAIHAGARVDRQAMLTVPNASSRDLSVVVGTVLVRGVHKQHDSDCVRLGCVHNPWAQWSDDPRRPVYHWMIGEPRQFITPIRAFGQLRLWTPGPSVQHLIEIADYR